MRKCLQECLEKNEKCTQQDCRVWMDYEGDLNCALLSVKKHGSMTLDETAKRLNLSIVRIKQIQDKALQKLQKNRRLKAL
tara:strand:+ start:34349 stop:34588 length:240 start_codon:yes stop_codon:yes gene_type:complete